MYSNRTNIQQPCAQQVNSVLPSFVKAEAATLGSMMLCDQEQDHTLLGDICRMLSPHDFSDPAHQTIFSHLRHLFRNSTIDVVLLVNRLRDSDEYDKIGGAAALAEIGDSVPTCAHLKHYADIVLKSSTKRQAILRLTDSLAKLKADDDPLKVLQGLQCDLDALQNTACRDQPTTTELFDRVATAIVDRERPQLFDCASYGSELGRFPVGPEQVTMLGAPPAAGKTALVGQLVFDALRVDGQEELRLLIGNVEMSPQALWTRQLARLSGVSYSYLHHRDYDDGLKDRIVDALRELRALTPRLEFLSPPFTLEHLKDRAQAMAADIVLVDYAQRFSSEGKTHDLRTQTNQTMDVCRHLASQGRAVVVVSALNRQRNSSGTTYDSNSQGLASFRESSELEYGADSAWLLLREPDSEQAEVRCVKNRMGKLETLSLMFDGSHQQFRDAPETSEFQS